MYTINPDAKHTYGLIEEEKTPVYFIDDLLLNPEIASQKAAKSTGFEPLEKVVYPGTLLHFPYIVPEKDIINDVEKGRLTSNMFIEFF